MEKNDLQDKLIKVEAGSAGTIIAGKIAAIKAGAKGATEVDIEDKPQKIIWLRNLNTLRALFELLYEAGYIDEYSYTHIPSIMKNHFLQRTGENISRKSQKEIEKIDSYEKKKSILFDDLIGDLDKANSNISER